MINRNVKIANVGIKIVETTKIIMMRRNKIPMKMKEKIGISFDNFNFYEINCVKNK